MAYGAKNQISKALFGAFGEVRRLIENVHQLAAAYREDFAEEPR